MFLFFFLLLRWVDGFGVGIFLFFFSFTVDVVCGGSIGNWMIEAQARCCTETAPQNPKAQQLRRCCCCCRSRFVCLQFPRGLCVQKDYLQTITHSEEGDIVCVLYFVLRVVILCEVDFLGFAAHNEGGVFLLQICFLLKREKIEKI